MLALSKLRASYLDAAAENKIQDHLCDLSLPQSLEANLKALLEISTYSNTNKLDHITYTAVNVPRLPGLTDYQAYEPKASILIPL